MTGWELPQLLFETLDGCMCGGSPYADAGYDVRLVHCWCRGCAWIQSWILAGVRRVDGPGGGKFFSKLACGLPKHSGVRWPADSLDQCLEARGGFVPEARLLEN